MQKPELIDGLNLFDNLMLPFPKPLPFRFTPRSVKF